MDDPENGTASKTVAECRRGVRLKFRYPRPGGATQGLFCRSNTPLNPTHAAIREMAVQGGGTKRVSGASPSCDQHRDIGQVSDQLAARVPVCGSISELEKDQVDFTQSDIKNR